MANPYVSPASDVTNRESTSGNKNSKRGQLLIAMASGTAVAVLTIVSLVLITQALRLESESANLPARLRVDYASTARSSWIGGIAAIVGVLLNGVGLLFVRKNKLVVPIALFAVTVIGVMAIAVLFKPS